MAQAGEGQCIGPGLAQQGLHETRWRPGVAALVDLCGGLATGQFQSFLAARGFHMAALGQFGTMGRRALVLLHVFTGGGKDFRRTRILPQQALHALRHALQQLRVDILIAQPVGADFGDLIEQLTRGVFVAHEEARIGHGGACQGYLQAGQQRGRHWIGTLLLLHLLHQHAQQVEVVPVVTAQLGLRTMLAAQLRDHGSLQVGHTGCRTGLGLQAREYRVDCRAGHRAAVPRGRAAVPCLLQQLMQCTASGGGHARRGGAGCAALVEGVLYQAGPGAGRCRTVPAGQGGCRALGRLRGAAAPHRLGDDPPRARRACQVGGVDQPRQYTGLGQQGIGTVKDIAQPFQHLPFETAIQRQLYLDAQRVLFGNPAHHRAQCLRCQWQGVGLEGRRRRQHAQALAKQVQCVG